MLGVVVMKKRLKITTTYNQVEFVFLLKDLLSSDDGWSYNFQTIEGTHVMKFKGIKMKKVQREILNWLMVRRQS